MRLHIKTTPSRGTVKFSYQEQLVGVLHKWLGENNNEHGCVSLYSFSWLHGGRLIEDGFAFPEGSKWFLSFYDAGQAKQVMKSILDDPVMFCGMIVTDIVIEETPNLESRSIFYLGSPILVKKFDYITKKTKHYTFENDEAGALMTRTLRHKMELAGIPPDDSLQVRFNLGYEKKKVKLLTYRGIGNKASLCSVFIDGLTSTKSFAWNVGIGNSTRIGFGSIY